MDVMGDDDDATVVSGGSVISLLELTTIVLVAAVAVVVAAAAVVPVAVIVVDGTCNKQIPSLLYCTPGKHIILYTCCFGRREYVHSISIEHVDTNDIKT